MTRNGTREPYVTEAFAGPNGWVMRLDPSSLAADGKAARGPTKAVGVVEIKWREGRNV